MTHDAEWIFIACWDATLTRWGYAAQRCRRFGGADPLHLLLAFSNFLCANEGRNYP